MNEAMPVEDKEFAVQRALKGAYANLPDQLVASVSGLTLREVRRLRRKTCRRGGPIDRVFQREDKITGAAGDLRKIARVLTIIADTLAINEG